MSTEPISKARLDELIIFMIEQHALCARSSERIRGDIYEALKALRDYARLREENVEADARRYRWLREHMHVNLLVDFFGNGCVNRRIDEVDAAIDAALQGPRHE